MKVFRVVIEDNATAKASVIVSWNRFWAGRHWSNRQKLTDNVRLILRAAIQDEIAAGLDMMFDGPVEIAFLATYRKKSDILDADNVCIKPWIDALTGTIIQDDNVAYVRRVSVETRHDPEQTPRRKLEIKIFKIKDTKF